MQSLGPEARPAGSICDLDFNIVIISGEFKWTSLPPGTVFGPLTVARSTSLMAWQATLRATVPETHFCPVCITVTVRIDTIFI